MYNHRNFQKISFHKRFWPVEFKTQQVAFEFQFDRIFFKTFGYNHILQKIQMAEEQREIKTAGGDVYFGTQRDGRPHGRGKLTLKDVIQAPCKSTHNGAPEIR